MRLVPLILLAGCHREPAPTLSNKVETPASALRITPSAFGPLGTGVTATLSSLRKLLVGYDVRPFNDGSLEYDVYLGGEKLFYVVPNDDGTVFNVHAVSGKIAVAGRSWRVGSPFSDSVRITRCECWGDNPTCFTTGEHVAVNFDRPCSGLTDNDATSRAFRVLDGAIIQRVIWSPTPFGEDSHDDGEGGV